MTTITFLGDVYLGEPIQITVPLSHYFIVNLEGPITDAEFPYPNKINLKASGVNFDLTFPKTPVAVCLANNHIMDYCERGLEDTVSFLEERGIQFFGCGYLDENANNPLVLDIAGISVGMMGYVCCSTTPVIISDELPGCAPIDLVAISRDIAHARTSGAECIIVQLHWGAPNISLPKPEDVKTARKIIDLGADMIIGHHAHRIQHFEFYKGKYIFYGLGNCIMPNLDVPSYSTRDGRPTRRHMMKQFRHNRRSLAVMFDLVQKSVTVLKLEFNDGKLSVISEEVNANLIPWCNMPNYEWIFRVNYIYCRLRGMFLQFLSRPKWPTGRHVRKIVGLFGDKELK